jgi:hypothetical protein
VERAPASRFEHRSDQHVRAQQVLQVVVADGAVAGCL